MTSASRPTWSTAMGSSKAPSMQYSSRDLTMHAKLKLRALGQGGPEELKSKDLRAELFSLENKHTRSLLPTFEVKNQPENLDEDFNFEQGTEEPSLDMENPKEHSENYKNNDNDNDNDNDEDEDEDDMEALLKELEKIKKERSLEKQRKLKEEEESRVKKGLASNPLLNNSEGESFTVKRRWDDDVVFKNQASSLNNRPKKRFINDTLRSDFHRKFLDRYIK